MGCATHSSQPKRVPLLLLSAALATLMALPSAPNSCSALQASPAQASAAPICRRGHALRWLGAAATGLLLEGSAATPVIAEDDKKADYLGIEKMPGLAGKQYGKQRKRMPNFTVLPSGLQVKDVDLGRADTPEPREGDAVVITWEGYTINYFGRPYETRTLQEVERIQVEPLRFKVGDGTVIPAIDEAVRTMHQEGLRQLIVPVELGYDAEKKLLPRPSTFSGQRALDFVMDNQGLIDKTLLINVRLKKVYPGDAAGSAK